MSSSKGLGLTGEELLDVLTPEATRYLMIKTDPNRAVEFNPKETDIIPKLYDEYQKAAAAYFEKTDEDLARSFELSQIDTISKPPAIRFSVLAQWIQMPNMQDQIQKEGLEDWAAKARVWVEKYAPESDKFLIQKSIPQEAQSLTDQQKQFLHKIPSLIGENPDGEDLQKAVYNLAKEMEIPAKDAFAAIYLSLIGKNHGPKAGWLIASLDREFIKKRFGEV